MAAMSGEGGEGEGRNRHKDKEDERCEPVFLINNQLPGFETKMFTTSEICAAAERQTGYNSIEGAQRIGGLWRIYPRSQDNRMKLLMEGIVLRGVLVTLKSRNPFLVGTNGETGDNEGSQPPTTKLIISNVPLSYSDDDILQAIKSLNVSIQSKLIPERDRDERGRLTHWKTGRRFVYISVPASPLPRALAIGPFKAALFHPEQRTAERQQAAECRRCLQRGHKAYECTAPVRCRQCLQDGHRAGDPLCTLTSQHPPNTNQEVGGDSEGIHESFNTDGQLKEKEKAKVKANEKEKEKEHRTQLEKGQQNKGGERGRSRHRALSAGQTTLSSFRRDGSGSLKRKSLQVSPGGADDTQQMKQRRIIHDNRGQQQQGNHSNDGELNDHGIHDDDG